MGTHAKDNRSAATDAAKTALGGLIFCGILYLLDLKFQLLKTLNIEQLDVQMIAAFIVVFAVFWPLLSKVMIEPYMKLAAERERLTVDADAFLQGKESEAQELADTYENRIAEARGAGMKQKLARLAAAKTDAAKVAENAQAEAQSILRDSRAKMRQEVAAIDAQLEKEADALARSMVERVLSDRGAGRIAFLVLLAAVLFLPLTAYAAAGAHGEGHEPSIADLKFFFINFVIYLLLVGYLFKKFAPGAWASRRQRITQAIENSRQKIKNLDERIASAKGRLARVDEEVKSITAALAQETEREAEQIKASAAKAAERVLQQARATAQAEQKAAAKIARKRLAELALKAAEEKLTRDITAEQDKTLMRRVETNIGKLVH